MKRLLLIFASLASSLGLAALPSLAQTATQAITNSKTDIMKVSDFVGSETCELCHADLSKKFASNPHAALSLEHGGKGVTCENCHGGGRAHVESGGDPTKIFHFDKAPSKVVDAKCLACHLGTHANFDSTAHGAAGVGCTSCHSKSSDQKVTYLRHPITSVGSLLCLDALV